MKQDKYDGVQCAIFEADGGAWEIEAVQNIRKFLEDNLAAFTAEGETEFIIIS